MKTACPDCPEKDGRIKYLRAEVERLIHSDGVWRKKKKLLENDLGSAWDRIKRLEEVVKWALNDPIITEDAVLKQYIIFWRQDLKYRLEHGPQPRPSAGKEGSP